MYQPLCDAISLILDVSRVKLSRIDEAVRLLVHVVDAVLVGNDVSLDQLVLLHQILDGGQVLAELVGCQQGLHLAQPEVKVLRKKSSSKEKSRKILNIFLG